MNIVCSSIYLGFLWFLLLVFYNNSVINFYLNSIIVRKLISYDVSSFMVVYSVCKLYVLAEFLFVLLVSERGVLKTLAVIVDVFTSSFNSISFCFYYFEAVLLSTYIFRILMPSWWIDSCHYVTSFFIPSKFSCFEAYFVWY